MKDTAHDRKLEYMRDYNAKHADEHRAYNRQWYLDHQEEAKEKARKYRQEHPEKVREAAARWREENKEHRDAYNKAYQAANKKRIAQNSREKRLAFFAEDPKAAWLFYTFQAARGRARRRGLSCDDDPSGIELPDRCPVLGIELKYGERRKSPQADSPSLDRVVPSRGYVSSNMRVISWRANVLKRDASVDEIRRVLAYVEECLFQENT